MGHKVHPIGFRIGVIRDWQAKWYAGANYAEALQEDLKLRKAISTRYADAAISLVEIDRQAKEVSITIHTARPGIVIGRGGQRVDELRAYLEKLVGKKIRLNIQEIRQPELDASLVARTIADQIERRIAYRRAIKQAMFRTIQAGAKGIRISCSGRLGDAEIARRQTTHQGQVPLHTLRADIDYGFTEARTTLGRIGVKVWIYRGEILPEPKKEAEEKIAETAAPESNGAVPPAEAEEKPAKPRVRRSKVTAASPEAEEKPAETAAPESNGAALPAETEEKPAKPRVRRSKETAASPEAEVESTPSTDEEEKDAAT